MSPGPVRTKHLRTVAIVTLSAAAAWTGTLAAQAVAARRAIGPRRTVPPYADGKYGEGAGTPLHIAVLGDSAAAGLGAERPEETMGAIIALRVSQATGRRVVLINHAVVGAVTSDLDEQIDRALVTLPHVAVIMVGANDITHLVPIRSSARTLGRAVDRLRDAGVQVVMGTCPDLGTVKPIRNPLRSRMRRKSRRLAAAQRHVVLKHGGFVADLGAILGPEFDARPDIFFASDRFHPSAAGYAAAAELYVPEVLKALRVTEHPALPAGPA